jgi:hypothetical protein
VYFAFGICPNAAADTSVHKSSTSFPNLERNEDSKDAASCFWIPASVGQAIRVISPFFTLALLLPM